jgi:ABC-2 type transport system permease protein
MAMAMSLLSAGVGLLVASVGRTEASARSISIVVILAMSMLGGLWMPAFLLPKWVRDWSTALPTSWAIRGLDGVTWQGAGLTAIWPCVAAVNLFAIVFLLAAALRLRQADARRRRGGLSCL